MMDDDVAMLLAAVLMWVPLLTSPEMAESGPLRGIGGVLLLAGALPY